MNEATLLQLLQHGNQLKRTTRTGWAQRGIHAPEDVAAHSFGVVYITLMLAFYLGEDIPLREALIMAVLHDLPEGLTTDIPTPAWKFLPAGVKTAVERQVMQQILGETPPAPELLDLWEELHAGHSPAARLVHDADKLDMYLQAYNYERQTGNRQLAEFWEKRPAFSYPLAQALYDQICSLRKQE